MLAPICLFTYNRLNETCKTIEALQKNFLAIESELYIYSDGGANQESWSKVNEVRKYLRTITGFKSITIIESELNKKLASSIIEGVSKIVQKFGKVIVLEDDLITTPNFLDYMNQCLDFYEKNEKVLSISGYSFSNNLSKQHADVLFGYRASSWGWATWLNRWEKVDWSVSDYPQFSRNLYQRFRFNRGGSDMAHMLKKQMNKRIDSWAIRFCFHQFKYNLVDVYPVKSKVYNIGIGKRATNSKTGFIRFNTKIDNSNRRKFNLNHEIDISGKDQLLFRWRYSVPMRILDRISMFKPTNEPCEILVFHPAIAPYRIDFFNYLANHSKTKFYFSLKHPKEQKFSDSHISSEINFEHKLFKFGSEIFGRTVRFGTWIKLFKHKPKIVICSEYSQITLSTLLYKLLINKKLKVYTICDDSLDLSIKRKGVRKWIRTICSNKIDGIIFPSNAVCEWYNNNVNLKTLTLELPIIHDNIIYRNKLENSLSNSTNFINAYNLLGKKTYLFVGRLVNIKNVELLIKAFAKAKIENGVLIIVGEGIESDKLQKLSSSLNLDEKCIFTGKLEGNDLLAWYNIAQYFILPSFIEPYGAVVNEALIAGCKVFCSNLAGSTELITNNNGSIFNPFNEVELVQLIQNTSSDSESVRFPLNLKKDLMPFSLESKLEKLILNL